MKAYLGALPYFIGWRIIRLLPEKSAYRLFAYGARYMAKKNGRLVQRLRENLSRVKPELSQSELEELVERSLASYMRYWCDTFRSPGWSPERVLSTVTVTNEHLIMDRIKAKEGVVVALPHSGNWDHAAAYFCLQGARLVTVAERLKPEAVFQKFLRYREAIGMEVLPLDGRSIATLLNRAREGGLIALVADRDLSHSGIEVEFFGHTAKMPAGPALIALRASIPLLTASVTYTETGIHIYFRRVEIPDGDDEAIRVATIVNMIAKNFEQGIASHPQDWHMLQRIWIDQK